MVPRGCLWIWWRLRRQRIAQCESHQFATAFVGSMVVGSASLCITFVVLLVARVPACTYIHACIWFRKQQFHYKANNTEYGTDLILQKAVEWIKRDNVSGAAANGRPFFVYFAPHCPHTPAVPADKYVPPRTSYESLKCWL